MVGRKWSVRALVIMGCLLAVGLAGIPKVVFASNYAVMGEGIADKAVFQDVYKCYKNGKTVRRLNLGDYQSISSLLTKTAGQTKYAFVTGLKSDFAGGKYKSWGDNVTCLQLFVGSDTKTGALLKAYGKSAPNANKVKSVQNFMAKMGYDKVAKTSGSGGETCYTVNYSFTDNTGYVTNGKTVNGTTNAVCMTGSGGLKVESYGGNNLKEHVEFRKSGDKVCLDYVAAYLTGVGSSKTEGKTCESLPAKNKFNAAWLTNMAQIGCAGNDGCKAKTWKFSNGDKKGEATAAKSSTIVSWEKAGDPADAALKAVRYLSGDKKYNKLATIKVNDIEKRILYQYYLEQYYGVPLVCPAGEVAEAKGTDLLDWLDTNTGKMIKCSYDVSNMDKKASKKANGISENGYFKKDSIVDLEGMLAEFDKLKKTYTQAELDSIKDIMGLQASDKTTEDSSQDDENLCYANSGALGWILCPVVKGAAGIGEHLWNQVEENHLKIPAGKIFETDGGVYQAWERVRNIANVVFIMIFLVVIFSQLTGVGIDNYGIKRILPKLIVMAIMINLSYVLCALAVDISNILGMSLNGILSDAAKNVATATAMSGGAEVSSWLAVSALAGGGTALFVLLNPAGAVMAAVSIGLAVLGIVITIVVSMLTLYLILVIREAGVVIMIVVAPLALVCYTLPNTDKIYKRWFDIIKALLLVYPICGAMVGAGRLAGAVLASIDTTSMKIAAMIVQVLPFFLIPMVLRNSMSLLGNIGSRVSSMGRQFGRRGSATARGVITNNERFKEFAATHQDLAQGRRAQRVARRVRRGWRPRTAVGRAMATQDMRRALSFEQKQRMNERFVNDPTAYEAEQRALEDEARMKQVNDRLALMRNEGIRMPDGAEPVAFTRDNVLARFRQLEQIGRGRRYTDEEQLEMHALMRGLSGMQGGGSRINDTIWEAGVTRDASGGVTGNALNQNFMQSVANIHAQDADVASAMNMKDGTMSGYVERFMPGGEWSQPGTGQSYMTAAANGNLENRIDTLEGRLKQGGRAFTRDLNTLSREECQEVYDRELDRTLSDDDRQRFVDYARDVHGVTGKRPQEVRVV